MSASLKISANTSEVKKSLLDLGKDVKNLGKTKVSVFSEEDRKFIKSELKNELALMKTKLAENKAEISKMVKEQAKLEKGSKEELAHRKKILAAYQQQTKLASQMDRVSKQSKDLGGFGGMGGGGGGSGGIMGMLGKMGSFLGGAALGVGAMAILRGFQANSQYQGGAANRVRLRGLGQEAHSIGDAEELARAGLTEQDFIKRQIQLTSTLGRAGGSKESILQQAKFERAFGLEEGSMANVSTSLRSSFGGRGADQAQAKLQASIMAAGIEDAIGPYLETATSLLADINKNGLTNTDEMVQMLAEMTKDGKRTPEQIADAFKTVDSSVRGATGEQSAFYQTAFSRAGIGGGTIGATRLAMQSGGIMGLSEEDLLNRGFNPQLVGNMKKSGFTSGLQERSGAILKQFKASAGIGGKNIGDITDVNTMTGLSQLGNSMFGTEGEQGFDVLQMLEKVQNKQMTQKQFDDKLQEMRDKKDPTVDRLNKINATLEGQTNVLNSINTNLMESLGKEAVKAANVATELDNSMVKGAGNVAGAVNETGVTDKALSGATSVRKNLFEGGLGDKLYDWLHPEEKAAESMRGGSVPKKGNVPMLEPGQNSSSMPTNSTMADDIEKGMTKALENQKATQIQNNNRVNIRIQNSDGSVTNKTHR